MFIAGLSGVQMKGTFVIGMMLVAFSLSACGTSDVTQLGPSTYTVSAQEIIPTGGWPAAEREAVAKGTQFCATKGEQFALTDESKTGTPGFTPLMSSIRFTCGADVSAAVKIADDQCRATMQTPELDPIRDKVELSKGLDDAPPFAIASNDTFPSIAERPIIARWATLREGCVRQLNAATANPIGNPLSVALQEQDRSFATEVSAKVGLLIVALYQGKLTYGEFAQKRYEIGRDGADAERQFRSATLIADHDRQVQAQQLAQQQFQHNLLTWSTYIQAVNARQPQSAHLNGTVNVRASSNCTSQRIGNFVNTNCQ